jgi:hypothetical protein
MVPSVETANYGSVHHIDPLSSLAVYPELRTYQEQTIPENNRGDLL